MTLRVATDIGGTFTDLVYLDGASGEIGVAKAPTTPRAPEQGVLEAIRLAGLSLAEVTAFLHGCTVVINAITERKGARTALVTTRGFRDVLEIGRGNRPGLYDLRFQKPVPFVPRSLRFEVRERVTASGEVIEPLHLEDLDAVVAACQREGVEAIAVCLLHAYAHPEHEERCAAYLRQRWPGLAVTISSAITREYREYERSSTAVLNAYVQPVVERYLDRLEGALAAGGLRCHGQALQSSGGTMTFAAARQRPIFLIESGPAAGVIGAAQVGAIADEPNVISLDIGGTTAKCSLIEGGVVRTTTEYKLEWRPNFPGYPVKVPVVDIVEIGAGGGSIAWFDAAGALKVGPQSAGAEPGPACYGRGGTAPTVTDAKLAVGVINPAYFLGGKLPLQPDLARRALAPIAQRLGLAVEAAAEGIIRLADARMIDALKLVSVRRGYDPREFALVAMGGGGPMHAAALGRELGVKRVVVPPHPGVFSAWAMLATEPRYDAIRTRLLRLDRAAPEEIAAVLDGLAAEAIAAFVGEGIPAERVSCACAADARYHGQEHTVQLPLAHRPGQPLPLAAIERDFHALHRRRYGFDLPETPVELVTFHVTARALVPRPRWPRLEAAGRSANAAYKGERAVAFGAQGRARTPVYERALLPPRFTATGPLIIEEPASTTLVLPDQHLAVDEWGNLLITP